MSIACYFRSGAEALTKTAPCNQTALLAGQHTSCCMPGEQCLTGGFCRQSSFKEGSNFLWRGGCTDKTWQDPACPNYCDVQSSSPGEDQLVWGCDEKSKWCCNTGDVVPLEWRDGRTNTTCCSIPDLAFTVEAAIYTTAAFADPAFSIATLSASSSTASSNPFSSLVASSESTSRFSSSISMTAASSPTTSVTPGNADPSSLAIGLGVGLGIFAAIMVSISSILLWRRRNRQIRDEHQAPLAGESWMQFQPEQKNIPQEIGSVDSTMEMEANGVPPTPTELGAEADPTELPAYT